VEFKLKCIVEVDQEKRASSAVRTNSLCLGILVTKQVVHTGEAAPNNRTDAHAARFMGRQEEALRGGRLRIFQRSTVRVQRLYLAVKQTSCCLVVGPGHDQRLTGGVMENGGTKHLVPLSNSFFSEGKDLAFYAA
jgi:hypothetical protein